MTTQPGLRTTGRGPSVHVQRARQLLLGGLAGGGFAAVACLLGFTFAYGTRGLASAALAAGMVLFFYTGGQLVMVLFADAGARTLLLVSLLSYSTRVVILGLVLVAYGLNQSDWPALAPLAMFCTIIAVVVGWLAAEIIVFSRLRITAYDSGYVDPASAPSATQADR